MKAVRVSDLKARNTASVVFFKPAEDPSEGVVVAKLLCGRQQQTGIYVQSVQSASPFPRLPARGGRRGQNRCDVTAAPTLAAY